MAKLTYDQWLALLRDPDVSDARLREVSRIVRGKSAFDLVILPDPEKVEISEEELALESAMQIGNRLARFRRASRFIRRRAAGSRLPVLVAEGDSWFQFPLLIDETIDALGDRFDVWCVSAAGDTAQNIVHGDPEYLDAIDKQKADVAAFLFSAAGNDIIGEDPNTGRPVLGDLVRRFNGDPADIRGHIDLAALGVRLAQLKAAYAEVVDKARQRLPVRNGRRAPILIHGYDYCFPYPWGANDDRDPSWAAKDEWLGSVFQDRGIGPDRKELRRDIIRFLIDALYDMLRDVAGDAQATGVHVVDCRGALPSVSDWADEIHATSAGFRRVADRFAAVLTAAGVAQAGA